MRIADIKYNDTVNGEGICVSLFTQGCIHHCKGCFNPETWDLYGGIEWDIQKLKWEIVKAITANGVERNFSILGGDALIPIVREDILEILKAVRIAYPDIKIFLWTGYTFEDLLHENDPIINEIFDLIDVLIDGRYVEEQRDITLPLRGSKNQKVIDIKKSLEAGELVTYRD